MYYPFMSIFELSICPNFTIFFQYILRLKIFGKDNSDLPSDCFMTSSDVDDSALY